MDRTFHPPLLHLIHTRREPSRVKVLSQTKRYGLAAISCGLALALAWPFDAPASCFFLAAMVSSLYGGRGPGLFAVALSSLAFDYFFLPPRFQFGLDATSFLRFAPFLVANLLAVGMIEVKRRAEEARRQIAEQVQRAFVEIKGSEDRLRLIINTMPTLAWSSNPDGASAFINQRWLDYTGMPLEEALGWAGRL
jgi:K+-sensing histidine kinase KdpD